MTVKDRSTCSTAGITWLPKCVLLTLMWHLFWQVNVIFLVVTMYKMVKHSTSMKPDSSRIGGIRWGRRGGATLVDKEAELWLLAVRVCVCLLSGGSGKKNNMHHYCFCLPPEISKAASDLHVYLIFSSLKPDQTSNFPFRFYFSP